MNFSEQIYSPRKKGDNFSNDVIIFASETKIRPMGNKLSTCGSGADTKDFISEDQKVAF